MLFIACAQRSAHGWSCPNSFRFQFGWPYGNHPRQRRTCPYRALFARTLFKRAPRQWQTSDAVCVSRALNILFFAFAGIGRTHDAHAHKPDSIPCFFRARCAGRPPVRAWPGHATRDHCHPAQRSTQDQTRAEAAGQGREAGGSASTSSNVRRSSS